MTGLDANGDEDTADAGDRVGQVLGRQDADGDGSAFGAGEADVTAFLVDGHNPTEYTQALQEVKIGLTTTASAYVVGRDVTAQSRDSALRYFRHDGHGSTRLLLRGGSDAASTSGLVEQRLDYDAFGGAVNFDPTEAETALLYAGGYWDSEKSSYYLSARPVYMPPISRFTSSDLYEGYDANPATLDKCTDANN